MMKLPKNIKKFNMTNEEYMALSNDERSFLLDKLPMNDWLFYSEMNPKAEKPKLPCIIAGVMIY